MMLEDNKFRSIQQLREQKILKLIWKNESEQLNYHIATYKALVQEWATIVQTQKPMAILINTKKHLVIIEPKLQTWFANEIFPKYTQSGMKKLVFLTSQDFISQLSIEQTMEMERNDDLSFQTRYFTDEKDGFDWIFNRLE